MCSPYLIIPANMLWSISYVYSSSTNSNICNCELNLMLKCLLIKVRFPKLHIFYYKIMNYYIGLMSRYAILLSEISIVNMYYL